MQRDYANVLQANLFDTHQRQHECASKVPSGSEVWVFFCGAGEKHRTGGNIDQGRMEISSTCAAAD